VKENFYVVEIGTFLGESLKLIGDICEKNIENYTIISIDPYKTFEKVGKKNIGWHIRMSKNIKKTYQIFINNLSNYTFKKNVIHIRQTSDEAFLLLQSLNLKIDFCYIDGSHLYKNIKSDYVNFSNLIRKNKKYSGLISGDDYEYTFEELLTLSEKKENELLSILKDLENVDYTILDTSNKRKFGFHPGITLFFKEMDYKIIKFKSGFWINEN
tara:strand:- start:252 stop:890 length:639 start_codon:yes stop_codon:yes gene_type:complete